MAMYINVHKKCTKSRKSLFAQKKLKIICETFPNQWANKPFLVRYNFFYVILAHSDFTWEKF